MKAPVVLYARPMLNLRLLKPAVLVDINRIPEQDRGTPGMLPSAAEPLERSPAPSRKQLRDALSGNFCRSTGYDAIVDAVEAAARARKD